MSRRGEPGRSGEPTAEDPRVVVSATGERTSAGRAAASGAREAVRAWLLAKGHAVENARRALETLERARAAGELPRTPTLERMAADLRLALASDEDDKVGAKSADAARRILAAIVRELDRL